MLYRPESRLEWVYAGVVVAQAIVSLAIEGYNSWLSNLLHNTTNTENRTLFQIFNDSLTEDTSQSRYDPAATIPTLLSILIFAWLYLLILLYDTLATRNIYQTMTLSAYSLVIVLILGLQLGQLSEAVSELAMRGLIDFSLWQTAQPMLIASIVIPSILVCVQLGLTFQLRKVFAGVVLKQLEADVRLRRYYRRVEVSLLYFSIRLSVYSECLLTP